MMEQQVQDLRKRLQEQTSTNLEFATKLHADKEVSHVLQTEIANLKEELEEQKDKALVTLRVAEVLVEEDIIGEKVTWNEKIKSTRKESATFLV